MLFLLLGVICCTAAYSVTLNIKNDLHSVANDYYQAYFDGKKNFSLSFLRVKGKSFGTTGEFQIRADGEIEKYTGQYPGIHPIIKQSTGKGATLNVVKNTSDEVILNIVWTSSNGTVTQKWIFNQSPLITCEFIYDFPVRIGEMEYRLQVRKFQENGKLIHYPMEESLSTMQYFPLAQINSRWIYALRSDGRGVGLIAGNTEQWHNIRVRSKAGNQGYGEAALDLACEYKPLRYNNVPGKISSKFYICAGTDAETARRSAEKVLGQFPDVEIVKLRAAKLVTRPGEKNDVLLRIHSNSDRVRKVVVDGVLESGLGKQRKLDSRTVEIKPGETQEIRYQYTAQNDDYWGNIVRVTVSADGEVLDRAGDCCAVTNFAPEVSKYVFVNAAEFHPRHENGMETTADFFRRGMWGGIELYCWPSATLGGMTPQEDIWYAHTESQGDYESQISKKSLMNFIKAGHDRGISSFCWITGICNYYQAIKTPENIVYNSNGQPNVYNGNIYHGRRYTTTLLDAYSPAFAAKWAEEMVKSIDMFGWDGCRWDWNFIADAPNDPIWRPEKMEPWRNHKGEPADKRYPDPDAIGEKALRAWRDVVAKKYPNFIFSANFMGSPEIRKRYPKYFEETSRDGLMLYEYLHDPHKPQYKTFELWGRAMVEANQATRRYGSRVVIGNMFERLRPFTVSLNLARYVCAAAGGSFCGTYIYAYESEEYDRFTTRFAEYYFDIALRSVPDAEVDKLLKVADAGDILYRPFVYRRSSKNGKELVVHLINQPPDYEICRRHLPPAVRRNIEVTLPSTAVSVWYVTPQSGEKAQQLAIKQGKIVIPELVDAAILVIGEK